MHESWVANFGIGEVMIQLFSLSDSERLAEVRVMQSVADWPEPCFRSGPSRRCLTTGRPSWSSATQVSSF